MDKIIKPQYFLVGIGILIILFLLHCSIGGRQERGYDLVNAARDGNLIKVVLLVETGIDVNFTTSKGYTALGAAALKGHLSIVKYLLSKGADAGLDGTVNSLGAEQTGPNEAIKLVRSKQKPGENYLGEDSILSNKGREFNK